MSDPRSLLERESRRFIQPDGAFERLVRRRDRKRRNQRIAAGVVGIAVFVAAVWVVTTGGSTGRTQRPADEPSTVNPTDAAEDVVRGFLAAWGAFDPEAAMTYVADDANLRGLIDPQAPANKKGLSLILALAEAVDYQETITWCNSIPLSSGTHVVCGYDYTTIDAVALGRGPFTGSTIAFVVRDGEIVNGSATPNDDQYASQVRAPFAEWLAATYPRDFEVMYGSIPTRPAGFRHVHYRLTEESIRLFGLRTREYVEAVQATDPVETGPPEAGRAKTRLTIRVVGSGLFYKILGGAVQSTRPQRCAEARQVDVFRSVGGEPDPRTDQFIKSDPGTSSGGVWRTRHAPPEDGWLYAHVSRTQSCRAATSRTIHVSIAG